MWTAFEEIFSERNRAMPSLGPVRRVGRGHGNDDKEIGCPSEWAHFWKR